MLFSDVVYVYLTLWFLLFHRSFETNLYFKYRLKCKVCLTFSKVQFLGLYHALIVYIWRNLIYK